jgi:acyl-CoA thioesterase-1
MVRLISFFLFVIFLASCGTKPQNAETSLREQIPLEKPKAAEPPKDSRAVIVCFGDSITAGYGLEAGQTYPDVLQRLIDTEGYQYRVVNLGISGDTTQGALDRVNMVLEFKPKITVLELGGNDGLRGIPLVRSRDNLQQMASRIKGAGSKVLVAGITLPPNYGRDYIQQFDSMYTMIAKNAGDGLIPMVLDGIWNRPGMMQADQIHPTAKGAEQMAKNIFKNLRPLLEK